MGEKKQRSFIGFRLLVAEEILRSEGTAYELTYIRRPEDVNLPMPTTDFLYIVRQQRKEENVLCFEVVEKRRKEV